MRIIAMKKKNDPEIEQYQNDLKKLGIMTESDMDELNSELTSKIIEKKSEDTSRSITKFNISKKKYHVKLIHKQLV
jgi:hypothetical protein